MKGNSKGLSTVVTILALVILIIGIPIYVSTQLESGNPLLILSGSLIAGFFLFHLIYRRSLSMEGYFSSPYNLFTSQTRETVASDVPRELLFAKRIEVLDESKFRLIETDKENYRLLAITGMSLLSWGENLYIRQVPDENGTSIRFCSSTLFQLYSWNKNRDNFRVFIEDFERSLTI